MSRSSGIEMDLRRVVHGAVSVGGGERARRSHDYGRLVQRIPRVVVRPSDPDDVAAVVRYASAQRLTVATQAAAHSQGGQSLSDDGILLDMHGFGAVEEVDAAHGIAQTGAGVSWRDVVAASLTQRTIPPVLTDNLFTSVGGTAAVGGIGFSSHRYGVQLDNVVALEIVTGDGERLWCSAEAHQDLFSRALGGLGQFGVVTRARLRLRTHPDAVRRSFLLYSHLEPLLGDVNALIAGGRVDYLRCGTMRSRGVLLFVLGVETECALEAADDHAALLAGLHHSARAGASTLLPFADFVLGANPAEPSRSRRDASVVAPGLDLILPAHAAGPFITELLAGLPADVRDSSKFLLLFLRREALTRPMFIVPQAASLVLLTMETVLPKEHAPALMALLDGIDERGRRAGGKRYLAGSVRYDAAQWREHYGEEWANLDRAKRKYDPFGVFASAMVPF